jgi:hypothetical protein
MSQRMVKATVVVKRFEEARRWYVGSVREMFYKLAYKTDSSPKIEHKYTIDFEDKGDSLFHALNNILDVKYWGAVMTEMVDKTKYPRAIPDCFWERCREVPTARSCMNDNFRLYQKSTLRDIELGDNIYFILWDTRASGSDEPGVHIPQDNIFSGRRCGLDGERDQSDRHLSREWLEYQREEAIINVHGQGKSMTALREQSVPDVSVGSAMSDNVDSLLTRLKMYA